MFELSPREVAEAEAELERLEQLGPRINPYAPGRRVAVSREAMVATAHPRASLAAVDALREGGTAMDAALAAAAVLAVVEPAMTGPGGDGFMLYYEAATGRLHGFNGSGRAPLGLDAPRAGAAGRGIPDDGWEAVTVPGVVDAWARGHRRFGVLAFARALEPAIDAAERGFAVTEIVAETWRDHAGRLAGDPLARRLYLPGGSAPRAGERFRNPLLADSLRAIAAGGAGAFYAGAVGETIVRHAQATGGYLTREDLATHAGEWVDPIATRYRGFEVHQLPPNGQGIGVLLMLNLLEAAGLDGSALNSAPYLHRLIEAKKLAYADLARWIGDPATAPVPIGDLLDPAYARERAALIDEARASDTPPPGLPAGSDTTYVAVVDGQGNAASLINSLYTPFGTGKVGGETGILLQSRGAGFTLEPGHPNAYAPGRRPFHTIIPGMVTREGRPYLCYGLMGGPMQPQGHVQMLLAHLEHGLAIQQAVDLPRWQHTQGRQVLLEHGITREAAAGLRRLGHAVVPADHRAFGGAQVIRFDPDTGALFGASDPRKDGCALGL